MPDYELELELLDKGYTIISGMDECSRGSLFGPVYAAAVVLPEDTVKILQRFIKDSKKLTAKKRKELSDLIKRMGYWSIGEASNKEIDDFNILEATKMAMTRALASISLPVDFVLIDGSMSFEEYFDIPYTSLIKGDDRSVSVAAASIVAKEYQCEQMLAYHAKYPYYDLNNNKGYGTKKHIEAIEKYGPCDLHRKTFKRVMEYV